MVAEKVKFSAQMEEGGVIKSYLHSIKEVFEDELQVIFCILKVIRQVDNIFTR